jgi:hypothetical protein
MKSHVLLCASLVLAALPVAPSLAQSASLHGPVAGFVYQRSSRTLRPLMGIPGAAYTGAPVLNAVDGASVAPGGSWAIIVKDGHSTIIPLSGVVAGDPSDTALIDDVDRVVWSRNGAAALLYSSTASQLQLVRVSTGAATADAPLDLSPYGPAVALTIDPAGRKIAFGITGVGLYAFDAGQSPALLSDMAQPAAAAFDDNGRLYAVDAATQRLLQFDPAAGASEFAVLSQPDGPTVDAAGMAVSAGGRYLMLADRSAHAVRVYDTASGALSNMLALDFAPTRMDAISAGPIFLLNGDAGNEWLLLLDARNIPATFFVPASTEDRQ